MDALAVDPRRFGAWANRDYRVAKAVECFGLQFGVHYPFEERRAGRDLHHSPLHDHMLARGAVMGFAHGTERPNWFSDKPGDVAHESFRRTNWFDAVAREVDAVANRVALADLSVFSKFDVTGTDTIPFLNALGANRPPRPGRIGLTHVLTPAGGVASEFTVTVLSEQHAYLTSAAASEEMDLDLLTSRATPFDVAVRNITRERAIIGVMGPHARMLLAKLTSADLGAGFPWLTAQEINVAGRPVLALRVSYVGELGWELHMAREDAVAIFEALEAAGKPLGLGFYGAYAAQSMRLEKGYRAWGADLTTERTPLETGLDSFVKTEGRSFTGRDAMLAKAQPWTMVLLDIDTSEVDPFYAHALFARGQPVGIVTSGAFGHRTKKTLALAFLREPGMREGLQVKILGNMRAARILDVPPYDPTNERLKA